jgi:hypothetical protein
MNADEQRLHANCAGRIRAIQDFHMDGQGWLDIAYNHVFCRHGFVFAGAASVSGPQRTGRLPRTTRTSRSVS